MSNFTKAIQLNQQGCGFLYQKKQFDKAEECFKKAIQLDPSHPFHHASLGLALVCQTRYVEAQPKFLKAIQLSPNLVQLHNSLGWAYHQQLKHAEARKKYLKCIQLEPNNASYHIKIADMYRCQQKYAQAQSFYLKAIKLDPKSASTHNSLACTLYLKNDYAKMGQCLKKAVELSQNITSGLWYLVNLSYYHLLHENYASASDLLQKASKKWKQLPAKQLQQFKSLKSPPRGISYMRQVVYIFDYMKTKTKDILQNFKHDPLFLGTTSKYFDQFYQPITGFFYAVWNCQKSTNIFYTFQKERDLVISQIQRKSKRIQKLLNQEQQKGIDKISIIPKVSIKNQLSLQKIENYINKVREDTTKNNGLQFAIKIKLQKEDDLFSYLNNVITELEDKKKQNKILTKELSTSKDSYIQLQNMIIKEGIQSDNLSDTRSQSDIDDKKKD